LTGASGSWPRIRSAAFSAIMMTGALMLPPDHVRHYRGVDDAQPVDAEHFELGISRVRDMRLAKESSGTRAVGSIAQDRGDLR
jgi:hypothetical protein